MDKQYIHIHVHSHQWIYNTYTYMYTHNTLINEYTIHTHTCTLATLSSMDIQYIHIHIHSQHSHQWIYPSKSRDLQIYSIYVVCNFFVECNTLNSFFIGQSLKYICHIKEPTHLRSTYYIFQSVWTLKHGFILSYSEIFVFCSNLRL